MASLFGGGKAARASSRASQAQSQTAQQLADFQITQFERFIPLIELFINQQISQNEAVQPLIPQLLQAAVGRFQGAGREARIGPVRPTPGTQTPGADASQAAGGVEAVLASVPSPAEQATATGRAGFGEAAPRRGDPAPVGQTPNPQTGIITPPPFFTGPPPTGPGGAPRPHRSFAGRNQGPMPVSGSAPPQQTVTTPETTPAPEVAPVEAAAPVTPSFAFGLGERDFDAERAAVERLRTDVERQGQRGLGQLQLALGQRFGGSAAPGSLAAGAGAEFQSRLNEQFFQGTEQIRREQQALEAQRFNQLAQLIGGFSGVDVGPGLAAGQQAVGGLTAAGQAFGWQAAQQQQLAQQQQAAIGNFFKMVAAGAFGGAPGLAAAGTSSSIYTGNPGVE